MSPTIFFLLLALCTAAWISLPFVPTVMELYRRTDVLPLNVPRERLLDTRFFAHSFHDYIRRELGDPLNLARNQGTLSDGTPVFVLGTAEQKRMVTQARDASRGNAPVIIAPNSTVLIAGDMLIGDIYAAQRFESGYDATLRALYGEAEVVIGDGSAVLRWIHAEGAMRIGVGVLICGRGSSERSIELGDGSQFERLFAPEIRFGTEPPPPVIDRSAAALKPWVGAEMVDRLAVVKADVTIPADSFVDGDIVAHGRMTIGMRSKITGSIKAHRGIELEERVNVSGAVVSVREVNVGGYCTIGGPLISEAEVFLGEGTQVGSLDRPATVTAQKIYAAPGAVCHGTVWARKLGLVTPLIY